MQPPHKQYIYFNCFYEKIRRSVEDATCFHTWYFLTRKYFAEKVCYNQGANIYHF